MTAETRPLRVLLVDDHPVIRHGLAALLRQDGLDIVAQAESVEEALAAVRDSGADVGVFDLSLEQGSGMEVIAAAASRRPPLPAVVYTVHEDGDKVRRAVQAGVLGYVTKREDPDLLVEAIRQAGRGESFLSPRAARALTSAIARSSSPGAEATLSPQELQVFALTGEGHTARDIAAALDLSVRTVETYYGRILDKLDLPGRRELRLRASEWVRKRQAS